MNKKQFLIVLLISVIFLAGYLLRENVVGYDGYAYLSHACGKFDLKGEPPLAFLVISAMPCGFLYAKLLLFGCLFAFLIGLNELGVLINKENGWKITLLAMLSPLIFLEFAKFENDQFAYPILMWAIYFFFRGKKTSKFRFEILGTCLVLLASGFWYGSVFILLAFAFTSIIAILISLPIVIENFSNLIASVIPDNLIAENQSFLNFLYFFLLLPAFLGIPSLLFPATIFLTLISILKVKYAILVVPFLAVGATYFLKQRIFLIIAFFMCFAWVNTILMQPPMPEYFDAIDYAVSLDKNVSNDWDLGYWILWRDGNTDNFGGFNPAYDMPKGITVSRHDLNCELLRDFNGIIVYNC